MIERREFSGCMKGKNLRYVDQQREPSTQTRAGFLLLEHFSLPAFTQALDTIVTANLLRPQLFSSRTFGLQDGEVTVLQLGGVVVGVGPGVVQRGALVESLAVGVVRTEHEGRHDLPLSGAARVRVRGR